MIFTKITTVFNVFTVLNNSSYHLFYIFVKFDSWFEHFNNFEKGYLLLIILIYKEIRNQNTCNRLAFAYRLVRNDWQVGSSSNDQTNVDLCSSISRQNI